MELGRGGKAGEGVLGGSDAQGVAAGGGFRERAAQPRGGRLRSAAARRAEGSRPERLHAALISRRSSQQQVRGDALRRDAGSLQRLGGRGVPRLPLPGREVLIQGGAHDRVNEPQALGADEDVSTDEVICGGTSNVLRQTRHASGELQLAAVSEHGDDYRELARRRAERREPVQYEPAHGSWTDPLVPPLRWPPTGRHPLHRPLVAAPGGTAGFHASRRDTRDRTHRRRPRGGAPAPGRPRQTEASLGPGPPTSSAVAVTPPHSAVSPTCQPASSCPTVRSACSQPRSPG